jgi:tetratricopeptide (TPR) repeat protein
MPLKISRHTGKFYDEFGSGVKYVFKYTDDYSLYDEGTRLMYLKRFGDASRVFYEFYKEYPDISELSGKAIYYSGECAYRNNEISRTKRIFRELVHAEFTNESESYYFPHQKPSNVVKHDACVILTKIFLNEKNYEQAIKFVELSKKVYTKSSWCGNCGASMELELNLLHAESLSGLNRKDEAIQVLDQYLFYPNIFSDNREAIVKLVALLKEKYGKENLQTNLLKGIDYAFFENKKIVINFLNKFYEIYLFDKAFVETQAMVYERTYSDDEIVASFKKNFKEHYTYKLIMEE